jgi:hypothetical protein
MDKQNSYYHSFISLNNWPKLTFYNEGYGYGFSFLEIKVPVSVTVHKF